MKTWRIILVTVLLLALLPITAMAADKAVCPGKQGTVSFTHTIDDKCMSTEIGKYSLSISDPSVASATLKKDTSKGSKGFEYSPSKRKSYNYLIMTVTGIKDGTTTIQVKYDGSKVTSYTINVGHIWNNGTVLKSATLDEEGLKRQTCSTCGETREVAIPRQNLYITYKLNGGTNHPDNPDTFTADQTVVLKDPTRDGCTFGGWFADAAMTQRVTTVSGRENVTVYAKWKPPIKTINPFCPGVTGGLQVVYTTGSSVDLKNCTIVSSDPSVAAFGWQSSGISAHYNYNPYSVDNYITLVVQGLKEGKTTVEIYYQGDPVTGFELTVAHDWGEPTYEWNDDCTQVTAKRTCCRYDDEEHEETETAATTAKVKRYCTEKGSTTYTAVFENPAFAKQTKTLKNIPAQGHKIKVRAKVAPTCTADGAEACWECTACGKLFSDAEGKTEISKPKPIAKLGHAWGEPKYTWNADNTKVTATRTCTHNKNHKETETVKATAKVTKKPTCTAKGETTYTGAAFRNGAFTKQTKTVADIPAKGHSLVKHKKAAPTCTADGTEAYWECKACGKLFSDADGKTAIEKPAAIPKLGHDWGKASYTWSDDHSKVTAKRVCKHDAKHTEKETVAATYKILKDATTKKTGTGVYTSKAFRNKAFSIQTLKVKIPKYPTSFEDANCKYKISDDLTAVVTGAAKDSLTKVTIPDTVKVNGKAIKVTGIAGGAFKRMKKLAAVTIGKNVKGIGKDAFSGCGKLKNITIKTALLTKDSVKANAFKGINSKAVLTCPKAKVKEYKKFLPGKGVPKTAKIK